VKEVGLPIIANLTLIKGDVTDDGYSIEEAFKILKTAGADVVGINCHNGPD